MSDELPQTSGSGASSSAAAGDPEKDSVALESLTDHVLHLLGAERDTWTPEEYAEASEAVRKILRDFRERT